MRLPAESPDLNAFAERFVLSIKSECLERMVLLGEDHLRAAVRDYVEHYHQERYHQGLDIELISPATEDFAEVIARQRHGDELAAPGLAAPPLHHALDRCL